MNLKTEVQFTQLQTLSDFQKLLGDMHRPYLKLNTKQPIPLFDILKEILASYLKSYFGTEQLFSV